MPTADELFRAELDRRGIPYSLTAEGTYAVDAGSISLDISLANVRRDFERDGDAGAISRFVDQIPLDDFASVPTWDEARRTCAMRLKQWIRARCLMTSCSIG